MCFVGNVYVTFCRKTQPWFGANGNFKGNLKRVGLRARNWLGTKLVKVGRTLTNMATRPFQLMRGAYNVITSPRHLVPNMKSRMRTVYVYERMCSVRTGYLRVIRVRRPFENFFHRHFEPNVFMFQIFFFHFLCLN